MSFSFMNPNAMQSFGGGFPSSFAGAPSWMAPSNDPWSNSGQSFFPEASALSPGASNGWDSSSQGLFDQFGSSSSASWGGLEPESPANIQAQSQYSSNCRQGSGGGLLGGGSGTAIILLLLTQLLGNSGGNNGCNMSRTVGCDNSRRRYNDNSNCDNGDGRDYGGRHHGRHHNYQDDGGDATTDNPTTTTGGTWGDPWFKDPTNPDANEYSKDYGFKGEVGKIYNLLSDKNISINSKFVAGDPTIGTINGEMGIKLKTDDGQENRAHYNALTGVAEWNGTAMTEGQKETMMVNGAQATVEYKDKNLHIVTNEYDVQLTHTVDQNHDRQHFKITGNTTADKVTPNGLIGGAIDGDSNIRHSTDTATASGAVDYDNGAKFEVNDLFGDSSDNFLNRYQADVRTETDQNGKVTRIFKQDANGEEALISTLDKNGKLVSVRRRDDGNGDFFLTLADGTTKVNDQGDIIQ